MMCIACSTCTAACACHATVWQVLCEQWHVCNPCALSFGQVWCTFVILWDFAYFFQACKV